ncbi:hypothetical protein [Actinoplanes sp. NPDC020271]|uniref:hypothetical protein n=1 Tax=Actinoplanes sp. NPDC020271 TaxID=3363896 RepID=UPI00379ABEDC
MIPDAPLVGHTRTVPSMDARERRVDTARILGTIALVIGFLIAIVGLATDSTPAKGYLFAGMLVTVGVGLRLEAAITDRR